ncbi:MAG: tRNA (adenosine(37)-N6)-threonylcarbamoyltransferase complex dimerization subunit type 1 TsaB [Patescibacteria group bacterium]
MRCIFLDIASHSGIVAMVREKEVVASREVSTRIRDHELIPLVEGLLEEVEWKYEDLTHVACVVGPGGFTSLRVAVSFANTLIDQLEILGVGIHLSEVYFARDSGSACLPARQGIRNQDVFWLHATKRDSLFVKGGDWNEPTLVTLEEFIEKVSQGAAWMGELLEEQLKALGYKKLEKAEMKPIEEVLPEIISNQKFTSKPLEPWYGREG